MSVRYVSSSVSATLVFSVVVSALLFGNQVSANDGAANQKTATQCELRIISAATRFPEAAQKRGEGGEVRVHVVVDSEGQVLSTRLAQSSGYVALDTAAEQSVNKDWRFDMSHCASSLLPAAQVVSVQYQRVPPSFSAGINRRGITGAKEAANDDRCTVVPKGNSEHLISCVQATNPKGVSAASVAQRTR